MKRTISKKEIRSKRIRAKIRAVTDRPRLCVSRSNKYIFAQIIDDSKGITLVSAGDLKTKAQIKKTESAKNVGLELARAAQAQKIKEVVFDRGGRKFHGRVKALAEGAKEGGLIF